MSFPDKVKNIIKIFRIKGAGSYVVSTLEIIEAICAEPALHRHGRHCGRHEGDVPGCHPASDESGDGRGIGAGTLPAGKRGKQFSKLLQRLFSQNGQDPAGGDRYQGAQRSGRQFRAKKSSGNMTATPRVWRRKFLPCTPAV